MAETENTYEDITSLDDFKLALLIKGKEVLNTREAAMYLGCSEAWVNQQASQREIPHYKKGARKYFKKSELDEWRLEERVPTRRQIEDEARRRCARH